MRKRNTEHAREYNRLWYLRNAERIREYNAEYARRPDVKARRAALHQKAMKDPTRRAQIQEDARVRDLRDRDKRRARARELDAANPDRGRKRSLRRQYGLTLEQVDMMRAAQGGKCSICDQDLQSDKGPGNRFHIDHCHATGKVRALLCRHCNQGLGGFRDNAEWLRRAAEYVERFR